MDPGHVVVASCPAPREKFWGVLMELNAVGATLRAVPVESFEDWLRQWSAAAEQLIGAVTVFIPLHRIERIDVDETSGAVEGLADRFRRLTGLDARAALLGRSPDPSGADREH